MTPSLRPLCPYCRNELTDKNFSAFIGSTGCDTCGYGSEVTIDITCEHCHKLIYSKECK